MRCHAVMRHGSPRMILGRGLREPYVACVACELAAFERSDDCVSITDPGARGIHEIGAAFHFRDQLVVEEVLRFGMQRRIPGRPLRFGGAAYRGHQPS